MTNKAQTIAASKSWSITDNCAASTGGACELVGGAPFPDPTGLVGPMTIERCRNCGVGVTRPPLPDVAFLYAGRESRDFQGDSGGLARAIKRIAFRVQARTMLRQLGGASGQFIDFGCGSGLLTTCLAEVAAGSKVTGTDFDAVPPPDLTGADYIAMDQLGRLTGSADALIAMHVLEHDDDSLKLLRRMLDLVRPGGRLLIEVPNVDCIWGAVFGQAWDNWYLPFHRIHFSRVSLHALMQHAGLRVVSEHDVSVPSMGRTLAQAFGAPNSTAFILLTAILQPMQWLAEVVTRRPTALRIVVEKP